MQDLPEAVRKAVDREIDKLERMSEQNPEHGWIRTWLDTVLELPWGEQSEDRLDVVEASRILDEDHDGLRDVKDRILEHLAVRKLQAERGLAPVGGRGAGAILALVGPPGVGKTSLGESVARALGRSFVRVALGGVRDEAEIRGHRRTYVGAQPGRLVRALREAGTMNPVIVLDEVDKLGADYRGDPSSALLEVLDPAQNHTFRDHYLEVELDLSKVLFIATANMVDTIPGALLDRMEVIRLDGYTEDEKVAIARHHLVGRQLERAALGARRGRHHRRRPVGPSWATTPVRPASARSSASSAGCCARSPPASPPTASRSPADRRRRRRPRVARAGRASSSRRPTAPRCPGWPPAWPSPAPVATSSTSRRTMMDGPGGTDPDRSAGRRHEGVGGDRPVLRALARVGAGHRPGGLRRQAVPRPRPGRGHPEGRALGRGHHDHRAGQPAPRRAGPVGAGHDR